MKKRLLTILHIFIWIAGTIFLVHGSFNNQIWFDESYSVGIIRHNLWDLIIISAGDVHPSFYYVALKFFALVFGNSLVSLKLFSVLCLSLLAGLGFTHLRKDFGEKVGFWYTTLFFLFASSFKYANEIRMYTLAPLLVMLMAIYAYRFYKSGMTDNRSKVLFLVFAILGAYTHYYALAAAGAVNILFLIYCKKNKLFGTWWKMAAIQLCCYIPGFACLVWQTTRVVGGFWISMVYPDFVLKSLSFFLMGDVPEDILELSDQAKKIYDAVALLFWAGCTWFFYSYYKKNKEKCEPAILALKTLGLIIGFYFVVSLIRPLYYVRYLMVLSGLVVFFLAFTFDKVRKAYIKGALVVFLCTMLVLRLIPIYKNMYAPENDKIDTFIAENFKEGDIVVSDNIGLVAVIAEKHPEFQMYFYNGGHWDVEQAYKAYEPNLKTVRDLSEAYQYTGRIWTTRGSASELIDQNTDKQIVKEYDRIVVPYHNLQFDFILFE